MPAGPRKRPRGPITNATTRLDEHLDKLRLTTEFDHVFNSSEMGFAKPDVQIFELACDRLGLTPSDVVFVDDSPSHVEAAASVGIRAHLFSTTTALAELVVSESLLG